MALHCQSGSPHPKVLRRTLSAAKTGQATTRIVVWVKDGRAPPQRPFFGNLVGFCVGIQFGPQPGVLKAAPNSSHLGSIAQSPTNCEQACARRNS